MNHVLRILFVLILLVAADQVVAQVLSQSGQGQPQSERGFSKDKLFVGGGLGASFGNVIFIEASPIVGYRVNDFTRAGIGYSFRYLNYRDFNEKAIINGGSVFSQVDLFEGLFAHGEFEYLDLTIVSGDARASEGFPGLLLGGGYSFQAGGNAVMQIIALYNFLYDSTVFVQPYNSPLVIRVGFQLGL